MNTTSNADAGKNVLWPGATPLLARVSRQNPFGLRGSLPATVCAPLQANFPAIPRPQCRKFLLEQIDGAHMHDPESNRGQRPHASTETARTHDREASALAIGSWLALLPSIAFALVLARRTPLKTSFFAATCPLCRVGEQRSWIGIFARKRDGGFDVNPAYSDQPCRVSVSGGSTRRATRRRALP